MLPFVKVSSRIKFGATFRDIHFLHIHESEIEMLHFVKVWSRGKFGATFIDIYILLRISEGEIEMLSFVKVWSRAKSGATFTDMYFLSYLWRWNFNFCGNPIFFTSTVAYVKESKYLQPWLLEHFCLNS